MSFERKTVKSANYFSPPRRFFSRSSADLQSRAALTLP